MKKEYVITIMLLMVLVACSAPPASAWWYDDGLELSNSPNRSVLNDFSSVDNGSTVENFIVEHGSVYVPFEQGLHTAEDYTYKFPVPMGVTMEYAGLYADVWSANYCGEMNFTFNGITNQNGLGVLQFGEDGAGCGSTPCDSNHNVAGSGLGGNGVWFNVTNITNVGATNAFFTDDVTASPCYGCPANCKFDGRKRGCSFIEIYSHPDIDDTVHVWFNQGMEDLDPGQSWINISIYNVTKSSCTYWTLVQCVDCSDPNDYLLFNDHSLGGWSTGGGDHWMSVDSFDVTSYVSSGTNHLNYTSPYPDMYFHPYWVMLIGHNESLDPLGGKDLNVTNIETLVERDGQTPYELVQGYTYTINATVKNIGNGDIIPNFDVSLYNDSVFIAKKEVTGVLTGTEEVTVSFDWTPTKTGSNNLMVVADPDNDVAGEILENNNASSVAVNVAASGANSDLELSPDDLIFLPAYDQHGDTGNNSTRIVVNITNIDVSASGDYNLSIDINPSYDIPMSSLYPKAWTKCEIEYNAIPGNTYTVTAETRNVTNDGNPNNNQTSKNLKTINVKVKVTQDRGDKIFDVAKVVPENTTLYNAITSVAVVDTGDYEYKAYAIDGLEEDAETFTYWYAFVNGIPVPDCVERADTYQLKEGSVAHWDLLQYVNSGESGKFFKPRPIMDYPEPFLHGYNGTVWATTIVYPSTGVSYATIAQDIQTTLLVDYGVTGVNVKTNATLTSDEKKNNHLILLGLPSTNSIIAEVNANHTEVGMPVYFNGATMIDDDTGASTSTPGNLGGLGSNANVLEACDNPFNNGDVTDTWMDSNQTIWIASGVTDMHAEEAAEWLINRTCLLGAAYEHSSNKNGYGIAGNGFFPVQYKCGDVNGVGGIAGPADALDAFFSRYCSAWAVDANCAGGKGGPADALEIFAMRLNCAGCR